MASSSMASSRIELVARRQEDLHQSHLDFHVYAGQQLVGRIYHTHFVKTANSWFWGINSVTVDLSVGAVMSGFARDLLDAKVQLRMAFDRWLEWAKAMPKDDLKYPSIAAELKAMNEA